MVKEVNYLLSERDDGIRYLVGGNYFYLRGRMHQLKEFYPYIHSKRGVYLLIGKGKYYVGEGEVYNRLKRHRNNKKWVEKIFIIIRGRNSNMNKEESLQLEGSLNDYIKEHSNLEQDNKDKTREDDYELAHHIKRMIWLGLKVENKEIIALKTRTNRIVKVEHTVSNLYKIIEVPSRLKWLNGSYFESFEDIKEIVRVLDEEVEEVWI